MSNRELITLKQMFDFRDLNSRIAADKKQLRIISTKLSEQRTRPFINFRGQPRTRAEVLASQSKHQASLASCIAKRAALVEEIKTTLRTASIDEVVKEYCELPYQFPQASNTIHEVIVEMVGDDKARELIHAATENQIV